MKPLMSWNKNKPSSGLRLIRRANKEIVQVINMQEGERAPTGIHQGRERSYG